jgi:hypothetical protein
MCCLGVVGWRCQFGRFPNFAAVSGANVLCQLRALGLFGFWWVRASERPMTARSILLRTLQPCVKPCEL